MDLGRRSQRTADICRICIETSDALVSMFDTKPTNSVTVFEMLKTFCEMQLGENGFFKQICLKCTEETVQAYAFKMKCEYADSYLQTRSKELLAELESADLKAELKIEENLAVVKDENASDDAFDNDEVVTQTLRTKKHKKKKEKKRKNKRNEQINDIEDKEQLYDERGFKKIYQCPSCYAIFQKFQMAKKHLLKLHDICVSTDRQFENLLPPDSKLEQAVICDSQTVTFDSRSAKFDSCASSYFKCPECEYKAGGFKMIKSHIVSHWGEKYIRCDQCNYKCSLVAKLKKHLVVHSGEKPFLCSDCPYRANTGSILRTHMATQHSVARPFQCDRCTYTCKLKMNLAHHIMRTHDNVRAHACPKCAKTFFSSYQMRMHFLTHTGEKPQVCEHCAMRFIQKSNLAKHVALVHRADSARPHACAACAYRGKTRQALRAHERVHSGERPFACDVCPFTSSTPGALRLHRRRHVGDARHVCGTCDYRCYTANRLRAHERTHTGERPFPCDACNYRATTSQRLKNHKRSHDNRKNYACSSCPYRANYLSNLTKHKEKNCGFKDQLLRAYPNAVPVRKITQNSEEQNIPMQEIETSGRV